MSTLKKPLHAHFSVVSDRDNEFVLSTTTNSGTGDHERAAQIVRELNAFDALLAACEAARDWALSVAADAGADGELSLREDFEQRAALLQIAISTARPEPAKEQA